MDAADDHAQRYDGSRRATGLSAFWGLCHRYLSALETVRASADADAAVRRPAAMTEETENYVVSLLEKAGTQLPRFVAELKALARTDTPGVDRRFFAAAAEMADLMVAKTALTLFDDEWRNSEPLPPYVPPPAVSGTAPGESQSEADAKSAMERAQETLGNEEQLCMDEIATYAIDRPLPRWASAPGAKPRKPDRFAKVLSVFFWTKYNRAHYGSASATNEPPPKIISAYEFILFLSRSHGPDARSAGRAIADTEVSRRTNC
jgi:hypothetical protein